MSVARWYRKANALAQAWQDEYGVAPPHTHAVTLALAPAELETRCGDAWPGDDGLVDTTDDERNWGACTLRALTVAEVDAVHEAGVQATIGTGRRGAALAAEKAIRDAGLPFPQGRIHCDSKTVLQGSRRVVVPYFVWFATFPTDVEGARFYLRTLRGRAGLRPAAGILAAPRSSPWQLAEAMYRVGYYWGFHPHDNGGPGDQANIQAYADALGRIVPRIEAALERWTPGAAPPTDEPGSAPPPPPPVAVLLGLVLVYQASHTDLRGRPLTVDGVVGPFTRGALNRDLAPLGRRLA